MEETSNKKCPKCDHALVHVERKGMVVELCPSCRGMWFDPGELTLLLEAYRRLDTKQGVNSGAFCVTCQDRELVELTFPGTVVCVDTCAECHGIWVDDGELELLRESLVVFLPGEDQTLAERAKALLNEAERAGEQRFRCPKCQEKLWHVERQGNVVELCSGCQGMWFDGGELTLLLGVYRRVEAGQAKPAGIECVRCGEGLRLLDYPGTEVEIDACPSCQGVWLDRGELEQLKALLAHVIPPEEASLAERATLILDDLDRGVTQRGACPKCGGALSSEQEGPVRVERCRGCAGTWLDSGDLTRVLGVSRRIRTRGAAKTEIPCVRCPVEKLVELPYPQTEVPIDLCPDCRGVWLDKGELEVLVAAVQA